MTSRKPSTSRSITSSSRTITSSSYTARGRERAPAESNAGQTGSKKHKVGTKTTSTGLAGDQQIICALTESRGLSPTIGLAFVNLSTTEAVLCQIVDHQTYVKTLHKLHVFEPTEILIVTTSFESTKSKLLQVLESNLAVETTLTALPRRFWDETAGIDYIHNLAFKEDVEAIKVSIGGNFYATCCLAAVLRYIETNLAISFAFHSMRIKYEPCDGTMMMDLSTICSLELVQNLQKANSKQSLLGLLNQTLSPMGERMLRGNILQPLTTASTIELRYEALGELTSHEEMFLEIRQALKGFMDVDRALADIVMIPGKLSLQYWQHSINRVIMIKQYLRAIPAIFDALEGARSELLAGIRKFCAPEISSQAIQYINDTINEDVTYQKKPLDLRNQRTYAVKAGVNGLLDVARQTYKEANQDAYELLADLAREHEIALDMKFDQVRAFYFTFPASDLSDRALAPVFVNVFRKKTLVECQTLGLIKLNQKIADSHHEVLQMSHKVVERLIEDLRSEISQLFKISESIAMLDVLASLAQVATTQDYCRPEISSSLGIKAGRHPLREKFQREKYVPNDVYASTTSRLQIITGCNMSGKSTYIRSVALMTIMAQVGSFVPASYASFTIRHQLFARVSVDDSSTSNVSTFAAEMRETAFILRNIDQRSLVIIDELGRGTSTRDGLAIAIAIAEALVQSKALIWFVTHFRDLATVLSERPGVINLHLASQIQTDRMTMLYRVSSGPVEESHYGLQLAKVAGLPPHILEIAEHVASKLEKAKQMKSRTSKTIFQARRRKLVLSLREQLLQAKEGTIEGEALKVWLKNLQDGFVRRMGTLDDEERAAQNVEEAVTTRDDESMLDTTHSEAGHGAKSVIASDAGSQLVPTLQRHVGTNPHVTPSSRTSLVYTPSSLDLTRDKEYEMSGAL